MSEKKLDVDDEFLAFETVMRVRHAETDANQYLTLEALTALLTESWLSLG